MFRKLIHENSAQSLILKAPKVIMILMVIAKPGGPFGHLVYPHALPGPRTLSPFQG